MTQDRPQGVIEILQDELIKARAEHRGTQSWYEAEIARLWEQLDEALVRKNNLRAFIEKVITHDWDDVDPDTKDYGDNSNSVREQARKALAIEGKKIERT